jgi:hypothetical protein
VTINGELDLFSHTINPIVGLLALGLPITKRYRDLMIKRRYYTALMLAVLLAYGWMHFEREYRWWEQLWGVTFSTHTAVHVAILSALWQLSIRWRLASVFIGAAYALLMVVRHYHAPSDIALTAAALLPELTAMWWLAQARPEDPRPPQGTSPAG